MFNDKDTNTVYLTRALLRYPEVYNTIVTGCKGNSISVHTIENCCNIWCRDYMPIQVDGGYIKFKYKGYGDGDPYTNFPQLVVDDSIYSFLSNVHYSGIVLDGGNCQRVNNTAFISDIVFDHNPNVTRKDLLKELESLLMAKVVIIPREPGDDLGHTDGILKPIDEHHIFINDYSCMRELLWLDYEKALKSVLMDAGFAPIHFPYAYQKQEYVSIEKFRAQYPDADDYNPATGCYINYLQVGNVFFLPSFDFPEDQQAMAAISRHFTDPKIVLVDCSRLSQEGGLCNCVTMNYKE